MSRSGLKLLIIWTGWPGTGVEIKGWVGIKKLFEGKGYSVRNWLPRRFKGQGLRLLSDALGKQLGS